MWQWLVGTLAALSAEPQAVQREAPKAAASVAVAYAAFAPEVAPGPAPAPTPAKCCQDCGGRGYIVHGDGHRTACPCPPTCKCKATGATLTPDAPAVPAGRR